MGDTKSIHAGEGDTHERIGIFSPVSGVTTGMVMSSDQLIHLCGPWLKIS